MENNIEILKAEIEVLKQLNHTTAYTGDLSNIKVSSYVLFSDVVKLINQKRKKLEKLGVVV